MGGDLSNLAVADLHPHELVLASMGTASQADRLLPVVNAQISAAIESKDTMMAQQYVMSRHALLGMLGMTDTARELARNVRTANSGRSTDDLSDLAVSAQAYSRAYISTVRQHTEYSAVATMAKFLTTYITRESTAQVGHYTLLVSDFTIYRNLLT